MTHAVWYGLPDALPWHVLQYLQTMAEGPYAH